MEGTETKKIISALCSRLAKRERYLSKKDPKRPQVNIGNIRELVGYLSEEVAADPYFMAALIVNGQNRKKKQHAKG